MSNESIIAFFLVFAIIFAALLDFAFGYDTGKSSIINELCLKQPYDFCQVATYKLQENK